MMKYKRNEKTLSKRTLISYFVEKSYSKVKNFTIASKQIYLELICVLQLQVITLH